MKEIIKPILVEMQLPTTEHTNLLAEILDKYLSEHNNLTIVLTQHPKPSTKTQLEWNWREKKYSDLVKKANDQIKHLRNKMKKIKKVMNDLNDQNEPIVPALLYLQHQMHWNSFVKDLDFKNRNLINSGLNFDQLWPTSGHKEILKNHRFTKNDNQWKITTDARIALNQSSLSINMCSEISEVIASVNISIYLGPRMRMRFATFWKKEKNEWVCLEETPI